MIMPKPVVLFKFDNQKEVDRWQVYTDAYFGGRSQAEWRLDSSEVCKRGRDTCMLRLRIAARPLNQDASLPGQLPAAGPACSAAPGTRPGRPAVAADSSSPEQYVPKSTLLLRRFPSHPNRLHSKGAAAFTGRCSTELDDNADLARAGYCAANSKARPRPSFAPDPVHTGTPAPSSPSHVDLCLTSRCATTASMRASSHAAGRIGTLTHARTCVDNYIYSHICIRISTYMHIHSMHMPVST
jgi:hypothetical protein